MCHSRVAQGARACNPTPAMLSLAESTGWCALSVLQSIDVPDLTARDAAPVRRDVHGLAGGRDINRLAEWAGLRRDDGFARWGIHADHLSTVHGASESGERQSNESHNTALYHKQEVTLGNPVWPWLVGAEPTASRGNNLISSSVRNACSTHCSRLNTRMRVLRV